MLEHAEAAWRYLINNIHAWDDDTRDMALMAAATHCCTLAARAGNDAKTIMWTSQAVAHAQHYADRHARGQR